MDGSGELSRIVLSSFGLVLLVVEVEVEEVPVPVVAVVVLAAVVGGGELFPPPLETSTTTTTITTTIAPSNSAPARREPADVCGLRGSRGRGGGALEAPVPALAGPGPTLAAANLDAAGVPAAPGL